jgi:hypothetical protein
MIGIHCFEKFFADPLTPAPPLDGLLIRHGWAKMDMDGKICGPG